MAFVYALDVTVPANTALVSLGAGNIRDFKSAMTERVNSFFQDINTNPWVAKDGATLGQTNVKTLTPVADVSYALGDSTHRFTQLNLGATVTTSVPLLNATQTWNAGAVVFTALKLNVTSTASAAGSLLVDLQVASASKFSVDKAGNTLVAGILTVTGGVAQGIVVGSAGTSSRIDSTDGTATLRMVGTAAGSALFTTSAHNLGLGAAGRSTDVSIGSSSGILTSAFGVVVTTGGLTVSSGTSALQAATVTTLTASAALSLSVSAADATLVVQGGATSAAYTQYKRGSTSQWAVGTSITSGGIFQIYNNVLGAVAFSVDPTASAATFANSVTVTAGGLTVSSGTSALQALTATTGVFSSNVTATATKTASGATASTASATPVTLFTPATPAGIWLVTAYLAGIDVTQYSATAIVIGDGANIRLAQAYNSTFMTITVSGSSAVQATQSSGGSQVISYIYQKIG